MTTNPGIILGYQPPQFNTPMDLLKLKDAYQQTQMGRLQLQKGMLSLKDQQTYSQLASDPKNIDPATGLLKKEALINNRGAFSPEFVQSQIADNIKLDSLQQESMVRKANFESKEAETQRKAQSQFYTEKLSQYDADLSRGVPQKQALEKYQKSVSEDLQSGKETGKFTNVQNIQDPLAARKTVEGLKFVDSQEMRESLAEQGFGLRQQGLNQGQQRINISLAGLENREKTPNQIVTIDGKNYWADPKSKQLTPVTLEGQQVSGVSKVGSSSDPVKDIKPETRDYFAKQSLAGDNSWQVGLSRGKEGRKLISAVKDRIPELAKENQIEPQEASAMKGQRDALNATLKDRTKYTATANQFVNNFDKQTALVEKYLNPGAAGGTPIINKWIQAGRKSIEGDADVTALDTAIRGLAREHQRIVTGVTSNAQLHASAQETADELLNIAQTPSQVKAALGVMKEEAKNAIDSGKQEVDFLKTQLNTLGKLKPKEEKQEDKSPESKTINGVTYYKINGDWHDNPEGK